MKKSIYLAALVSLWGGVASADVIERACMASDRAAGNRALCGCIQDVANITLSRNDQKTAARLFRDPDRAQQVRMSSRSSDERFWQSYRSFGETAEVYCAS
ncbi:MAG: hypothetical protein HUJ27_16800 [Rhodobacteraceae bacterium]|nr:hypothetical protein [Paracoccaceae bacterium]